MFGRMKRIAINKDGTVPLTDFKRLVDKFEKEEETLKASRDYWKKKAETNAKENIILKWKLENAYLELKIWSNWMADYMQ